MAEKNTNRDAPGALRGPDQPDRGQPVQRLERARRLIADRRAQVDHGVHAAQGVAERARIGQVTEGQLHPDPVGAQAARVPHQAPHRLGARVGQPPEHRAADRAGGSRQ